VPCSEPSVCLPCPACCSCSPRCRQPPRRRKSPVPAVQNEAALFDYLAAQTAACYDSSHGGFVAGGVPYTEAAHLGFLLSEESPESSWRGRAVETLDWTLELRDTVGGGFLHAEKDHALDIPSFNKRTDSNAERLCLLIEGYAATGNPLYRRHAAESGRLLPARAARRARRLRRRPGRRPRADAGAQRVCDPCVVRLGGWRRRTRGSATSRSRAPMRCGSDAGRTVPD
jgi:hypothetical protein